MPKKLTIKEFIIKAKRIHKNKYNYSKVNYINNRTNVIIVCKKHGNFLQKPNYHLLGEGCITCSGKYKYSNKEFIEKCRSVHGNTYDYSNVLYKNSHTNVEIICAKHGKFIQLPYHHLRGSKCPLCVFKISKLEKLFLDYMKISNKSRNIKLMEWKKKKIDGYDKKTNTVYEFLGDYYHGNPSKYNPNDINPTCKKTYGQLYDETFNKLKRVKSYGYNVKYIWESDWKRFKDGIDNNPKIQEVI